MTDRFDLLVIGGGVLGSACAVQAAGGGMSVGLIERAELGSGASGVNAGTLSISIKRAKLIPYAMRGRELWEQAGEAVGYKRTGGLTLAFNEREAKILEERMTLKRASGAPIEMVSPNRVAMLEPGLSRRVIAASYCADDGFANSSVTGAYYRGRLEAAGVTIHEWSPAKRIDRDDGGYAVETPTGVHRAKRILLAGGAWLRTILPMVGVELPINVNVNTVSVTERGPKIIGSAIGHATGLLTMKQKPNGAMLIGGGWAGRGRPEDGRGEVVTETLLGNLRLARFVAPELESFRVVRSWTGFEAATPDYFPLAGALPGLPDAFVLGCVRGGYTIGPYIGRLMGDLILGRNLEMKLFDPGRFLPGGSGPLPPL